MALNPAVGRSQWAVDSEFRFGLATAVAGPTNPPGTAMNPALMQGTSFSITISDEYGLRELRSAFIELVHSRKKASYGIQMGSFGYSLYREWHGAGSIAFQLNSTGFGVSILSDRVSIPGYGVGIAAMLRLGTFVNLSESIEVGVAVDRILLKRTGSIKTHIPTSWIAAVKWKWISQASVSFGMQTEVGYPPTGAMRVQWSPVRLVNLSLAHEPTSGIWVAGVRVQRRNWSIPFGGTFHSDLGWSRHIGVGWSKGVD